LRIGGIVPILQPIKQITTESELECTYEFCKILLLCHCTEERFNIQQASIDQGIVDFTAKCVFSSMFDHLNLAKQLYCFRFIMDLRDRNVFAVLKFAAKQRTLPKGGEPLPKFFENEKRFASVQEFTAFIESYTGSVRSPSDLKSIVPDSLMEKCL